MNSLSPKELKKLARRRLSQSAYCPKKLTLWYSGTVLGLNLLAAIISWATGLMINNTGGLSAMGNRAILETVSTVFSLIVQVATPLLTMGFLYCCMRYSRQEALSPKCITMGLRRWAVILRHGLLVGGIFLAIGYLALRIASVIFMYLPGAGDTMEMLYTVMEDPAVLEGNLPTQQLETLAKEFLPVYIISGILFIAALIPISYRLRLSGYRIMEDTPQGAIKGVFASIKLMKKNCLSLFKLDVSFWWFYLLQGLLVAVMVAFPILFTLSDGWYVILSAGYSLAMLALEFFALAYVQTTYAVFYEKMLEKANATIYPQIEE